MEEELIFEIIAEIINSLKLISSLTNDLLKAAAASCLLLSLPKSSHRTWVSLPLSHVPHTPSLMDSKATVLVSPVFILLPFSVYWQN